MKDLWNFAYGGNMNPKVLSERRGIHPLESVAGVLEGYRLAFNARGFPWIEPVFANVEPAEGENVHGVLHRLTREQFSLLDRYEARGLVYRHVELDVKAYDGRIIRAHIYRAIMASREKAPSCRYLDILREGARQSRLDTDYVRMLHDHPCRATPRVPESVLLLSERVFKIGKPLLQVIHAGRRLKGKRGSHRD